MAALVLLLPFGVAAQAAAADQIYFSATDNITNVLVQKINAETQRIDMSAWYLTEHSISIALVNRFKAGVPVRLIGDRGSIFEIDPPTRAEFYWLASQGVPIRLRYNPDFFPEIDHWKFTLFSGQNTIAFGSANYTPFELAPVSPPGSPSPNYKDEIVMVTDDSALVNGFRTKFDQIWNDTMVEPQSIVDHPPYLKNWDDACAFEQTMRGGCSDYTTLYPTRTPMVISTARLEPDYPMPPDVVWGQGPEWNQRLIDEINGETNSLDFVIYRLTVPNITQALLDKFHSGVPMRIIVEPQEYLNRKWPEFWLSHAYEDLLWAMGVPVKQRVHTGLTHMKVLISSSHASVSSSNLAEAWERDHNYMLPAASKPAAYTAIKNRFNAMWNDASAFGPFVPGPPDAAENVSPISGAGGVSTAPTLVWNRAAFATRYEVLFGTSQSSLSTVGAVDAVLTSTPPDTYSFSLSGLQPNTTYFWRVRSLTNATVRDGSIQAFSPIAAFTTGGTGGGGSLPSPWVKDDIAATAPGSASFSSGTFTVTSTSADIWGSSDSFTFVHQPVSGDTQVVARVASMGNSSSFAKAGVMLRAGTGASAAHVLLSVRPTGDLEFMTRSSNGGQTSYLGGGFKTPPTWVRLQRTGSTVTAAYSSDGSSWTTIGSTSLSTSNIEAGLIVCSHASTASTSTFDNVTVSGVSNPGPPGTPGSPSPANNATGVSTSQTLTWSASNATSYDVRFGTSNPPPQVSSSQSAASYTPSLSASTTYFWQIVARNSGGSTTGPVWTFTTGGGGGGGSLPSPWVKDDIAAIAPGTASFASGTFTVTSTSSDIWGSSDSFTYVHQTVSGDTQIVARVASTSNSSSFAKAGIMLRAGTGAGAAHVLLSVRPTGDLEFMTRSSNGGQTSYLGGGFKTPPTWVRLQRSGSTVTAAFSSNGSTWTTIGSTSFTTAAIESGLIVCSHSSSANTSTFDNVAVSPLGPPSGPPGTPGSPSPANNATSVSTGQTLTWSSTSATSYDVRFGTSNPPPQVTSNQTAASYSPSLAASTTYFWQIVARNAAGTTTGPVWSFSTAAGAPQPGEIVIYANDVPAAGLHGNWTKTGDGSAAAGIKLTTPNNGEAHANSPLPSPTNYVDVTFNAPANTPFTIWLRLRALNNDKFNDAVWVQFSDALAGGSPIYQLNSGSGLLVNLATDGTASSLNAWGWQNTAYWLSQPVTLTFASSGTHTLRIQTREDGVQLDQIVLSPSQYLSSAPGSVTNDTTIVPKP